MVLLGNKGSCSWFDRKQGILVREIDSKNLVLVGLGKLKVKCSLTFTLFCSGPHALFSVAHTLSSGSMAWNKGQGLATTYKHCSSFFPVPVAPLWVSQKSLMWYCYRITSNCNHTRENGNKFSSLLGCLSLVNLYFCQKDPTLTQHHSGDSPWEHVAGQQNLDGSDGSAGINTKRLLSRTEPQSFTKLAFFTGNERKMFLSSSSFLKKNFTWQREAAHAVIFLF